MVISLELKSCGTEEMRREKAVVVIDLTSCAKDSAMLIMMPNSLLQTHTYVLVFSEDVLGDHVVCGSR